MPNRSRGLNVYLDLDRTLFRTDLFDKLRWQLLAKWYPGKFDLAVESQRQSEFYEYRGELYFYNFMAHMTNLGIDLDEVFEKIRTSELADGRLEYSGVRELINWIRQRGEARILTFGPNDYQSLKISLCPSLRDVEVIITGEEKSKYFNSLTDKSSEIWMVDDKIIRDLPENIHFVQANLEGVTVVKQGWSVIDKLGKIPGTIAKK